MEDKIIEFLAMIGTLISAIAAASAAIISMKSLGSWKKQVIFENRRDSVSALMSGAAIFQGTLKQVYSDTVRWPDDRETIELVSRNYWSLVALWPSAHASLSGDAKSTAEALWEDVFNNYNGYMSGFLGLDKLKEAVQAIYSNETLESLISPPE